MLKVSAQGAVRSLAGFDTGATIPEMLRKSEPVNGVGSNARFSAVTGKRN